MPTVNPVFVRDIISESMFPQPLLNEVFILKREGVDFDIQNSEHGKLGGSGEIFVTNLRLVFHARTRNRPEDFLAYQLLLGEILKPKYEQPIFGANYLKGEAIPIQLGRVGDVWRVYFNKGGSGTLLPVLSDLLTQAGATQRNANVGVTVQAYPVGNVAYVDPSDPSVIYVHQPVPATVVNPPAE
jgi:hypothetical protein